MKDDIKARQERNRELLRKAKAGERLITRLPDFGWEPMPYKKGEKDLNALQFIFRQRDPR